MWVLCNRQAYGTSPPTEVGKKSSSESSPVLAAATPGGNAGDPLQQPLDLRRLGNLIAKPVDVVLTQH